MGLKSSRVHYSVRHDMLRVQGLDSIENLDQFWMLVKVARSTCWFWTLWLLGNGRIFLKREGRFWLHYSVRSDPVSDPVSDQI